MEYMSKIAGSSDRKGSIIAILSQMGANFTVQQFEDVENIVVSFNPSNNRLVIGAHWDADEGSDGANDNASGCSVLLHVVEAILAESAFSKSVDFVFFGEEEKGGIGASRYIESVGKENISAMVNADVCGFGDNILLSDKWNVSNPLFFGLMDESLLTKHKVKLPGFLPQGDDCIFEWGGIPSVSICTAERNAVTVFSEIGHKISTDQPITEQDQVALMSLEVVKTMHGGEFDNISYLSGAAVKMVADYLTDGLLNV
ncbi:MAG: Zn-dependent exopeptidase M28 [Ruminococcaceae bacterium]|nr:Zn-dependent exopeptidase M28 [Oscillospiraceae bacterium]